MHHALHHSTCVSCIDILDRSVCARHTFEYTMYVFVLVGLWTHQFMTCDAPGPMLDRSSSSACHSSTSFCSRLQKKAASRCISSSCSIHATPTFCTFSYFPPHTPGSSYDHPLFAYFSCVNLLRICIRMGRARCSYLSVPTSSII